MKIPTDHDTEFMEPMSDEKLLEYAEFVVQEMDEEQVITGAGMEYVTRADNIPCEEDQDTIMALVEEMHRAEKTNADVDDLDQPVETPPIGSEEGGNEAQVGESPESPT